MNDSKKTKKALLASVMSLVLCCAMLIGTTFAWFTDTKTTNVNTISSGTLKVDLVDATSGVSIVGQNGISFVNKDGSANILWEPGATFRTPEFKVANKGSLALKYKLALNGVTGDADLLDVITFNVVNEAGESVDLSSFEGYLTPKDTATDKSEALYIEATMATTANNDYQDKELSGISITVSAAQWNYESDSSGSGYDINALYASGNESPNMKPGDADSLNAAIASLKDGKSITLENNIDLSAGKWDASAPFESSSTSVVFDGNGKTISGMETDTQNGGLFGRFNTNGDVTIKNLTIENPVLVGTNVDGESAGGALIGWFENHGGTLTIENVHVTGVDAKDFKYIGGLVGYVSGKLIIKDCSVNGIVLNSTYNESGNYKGHVGGIIGYVNPNSGNEISGCTVQNLTVKHGTTDMTGSSNRAGAFAGTVYSDTTITNSKVINVTVDDASASESNVFGPAASNADKSGITIE